MMEMMGGGEMSHVRFVYSTFYPARLSKTIPLNVLPFFTSLNYRFMMDFYCWFDIYIFVLTYEAVIAH